MRDGLLGWPEPNAQASHRFEWGGFALIINECNYSHKVYVAMIRKKHFRLGGMAALGCTRSVRSVGDIPVADYPPPGLNTTRHIAYCPLVTVSLLLLALSVSYFKQTLWLWGQL